MWLRIQLMKFADHLLFYTEREKQEFLGSGAHHQSVHFLNNGLSNEAIGSLRASYNVDQRANRMLFLGRLTEKSELKLLIEALALLPDDTSLSIIGDGKDRKTLEALSSRLGLETRITWHGALTDEKQISEVANQCALFVYPGAVGLSLIHAMNYGLPAVVHGNPSKHMPEIAAFGDGETGRSFEQGSSSSLAETVLGLIREPSERTAMSALSIEVTANDFSTKTMEPRFSRLIERAMSNVALNR